MSRAPYVCARRKMVPLACLVTGDGRGSAILASMPPHDLQFKNRSGRRRPTGIIVLSEHIRITLLLLLMG